MEKVIIYTDGACSGNPGPGGWGAILMYKETKALNVKSVLLPYILFNHLVNSSSDIFSSVFA